MGYTVEGPGDRQHAHRDPHSVKAPFNADGQPYQYCAILGNNEDYVYTDTLTDLLEYLIPGYAEANGEEEKAVLRIRYAGSVATMLQANILANIDTDALSDAEWGVLTAPKLGPNVAEADWWTSSVPLVAVQTSYRPYTESSRPAAAGTEGVRGDTILWLRPADPFDLLSSLHETGYIQLLENTDIPDEEDED